MTRIQPVLTLIKISQLWTVAWEHNSSPVVYHAIEKVKVGIFRIGQGANSFELS